MDVIRTIHPVGQGGFYTETFIEGNDKHTVVYDCGGSSQAAMEKYLKKYLHNNDAGGKMKIDAVFISHLHADHVNGLGYLLKNADVKYLILPQLTEAMKLEALVFNRVYSKSGKQINSLVMDLYGENDHYGTTKIIKVDFAASEERFSFEQEGDEVDLSEEVKVNSVKSKTIFRSKARPFWVYLPYNPPANRKQKYKDFIQAIQLFVGSSIEDASRLINTHIEACKAIYEKCFGTDHNGYSMTLFSGFDRKSNYCRVVFPCREFGDCWRYHKPDCLYTGDFEPDSFISDLKCYYDTLWRRIGSIQVPHHGSRLNYHPDLYDVQRLAFLSVGEKNSHDHPSIDTLINIRSQGCVPIVVTDMMSSIRLFPYHFELRK